MTHWPRSGIELPGQLKTRQGMFSRCPCSVCCKERLPTSVRGRCLLPFRLKGCQGIFWKRRTFTKLISYRFTYHACCVFTELNIDKKKATKRISDVHSSSCLVFWNGNTIGWIWLTLPTLTYCLNSAHLKLLYKIVQWHNELSWIRATKLQSFYNQCSTAMSNLAFCSVLWGAVFCSVGANSTTEKRNSS